MPFEKLGAVSNWTLELPSSIRQFDYNTISDVILHMNYTARDGGSELKDATNDVLHDQLKKIAQSLGEKGLHIAINMKHDLPNEWHSLKQTGIIELVIDKSRLPYMAQSDAVTTIIENVIFVAKVKKDVIGDFTINVMADDVLLANQWNLKIGNHSGIIFGTPFGLTIPPSHINILEELMLVVKYKF